MSFSFKKSLLLCVLMLSFFIMGCKELDTLSKQLSLPTSSAKGALSPALKQKLLGEYAHLVRNEWTKTDEVMYRAVVTAAPNNSNGIRLIIYDKSPREACRFESICTYQSSGIFLCPHKGANDPTLSQNPPLELAPIARGFSFQGFNPYSCGAGAIMSGDYIKQ